MAATVSAISFVIGLLCLLGLATAVSAIQETVWAVLGVGFWLIAAVLAAGERVHSALRRQTYDVGQMLMQRDLMRGGLGPAALDVQGRPDDRLSDAEAGRR